MKKTRKISAAEIAYINHDSEQASPYVNQFFVGGSGSIKKSDMELAVRKAFEANPGISLKLKGRWAFRYWELDNRVPIVNEYTGSWQGNSSEHKDVIDAPLDARKDMLASVTLFTKLTNPSEFKILFRIHHGICDGMGTIHWMQEVFRALRNEPLKGSNHTLSELDIIKREEYEPAENLITESKPLFAASRTPEVRGCHWVKCSWECNDSKIIAKIIYAVKSLTEEQHGPCKTSFRIPSDLRRYLDKHEKQVAQLGNISGLFDLKFDSEVSVNDIQNDIIHAMRNKRDIAVYPKKLTHLARFLPKSFFGAKAEPLKRLHTEGICNITAMISTVGKISLSDYSCHGFEAKEVYGIPMPLEDKSVYIGMINNEGRLLSVVSAPNALSNLQQTQAISERIENLLKTL